jgi:hypothetical protein
VAEAIDEFTLLCEACGYILTGLPAEGKCPECGRAIAESLPARRIGSPWQQRPGLAAWWRTSLTLLSSPRERFETLRVDRRRSRLLLFVNLAHAAVLFVAPMPLIFVVSPPTLPASARTLTVPEVGFAVVMWGMAVFLVLWLLTEVEALGVRIWGRRVRARVTASVSSVVCAHASIGWVVGSAGWLITYTLLLLMQEPASTSLPRWLRVAAGSLPILAVLAGLVIFETLVYIGIRRCRFANRVPPNAPTA